MLDAVDWVTGCEAQLLAREHDTRPSQFGPFPDNSFALTVWASSDVGSCPALITYSCTRRAPISRAAPLKEWSLRQSRGGSVEWDNSYRVQIVATDLDKTNHHAESILSFDIWGPLELDLTFIFDRVEKPEANADAEIPKSNDYRLTMGLGIDF